LGSFKITQKIGQRAYKLELPSAWKIHPVFHVSLLKKVTKDNFDRKPEPIQAEVIDNHEEYEVEEILDTRKKRKKTEYLVKWKRYGIEENT